jgi:hypothetical protein
VEWSSVPWRRSAIAFVQDFYARAERNKQVRSD